MSKNLKELVVKFDERLKNFRGSVDAHILEELHNELIKVYRDQHKLNKVSANTLLYLCAKLVKDHFLYMNKLSIRRVLSIATDALEVFKYPRTTKYYKDLNKIRLELLKLWRNYPEIFTIKLYSGRESKDDVVYIDYPKFLDLPPWEKSKYSDY